MNLESLSDIEMTQKPSTHNKKNKKIYLRFKPTTAIHPVTTVTTGVRSDNGADANVSNIGF